MLYGDTLELAERSNPKQPCLFFVFSDGIVVIRPPKGSVTLSANEANNIRAMGMVGVYGINLTKSLPDITAEAFAMTMGTIDDPAGRTMQTEVIAPSGITGAEIAKNGLFGAKVVIRMEDTELSLIGGKKAVREFGGFLTKLLGEKLVNLLK